MQGTYPARGSVITKLYLGIAWDTAGKEKPFLYPEFVHTLCRRATSLGFRHDKVMTNGVWHRDQSHLESVLTDLAETGFDGKLGLSVDKFHGIRTAKLAEFCRTARRVFGRDRIIAVSYASRHPDQGLEPIQTLARELDGVVEWSEMLRHYLLVAPDLTMVLNWNHLAQVERAERMTGAGMATGSTKITAKGQDRR